MKVSDAAFNIAAFYRAVDLKRKAQEKTWAVVAEESGVGVSTLSRFGQGKYPSIDHLVMLAAWANMDLGTFLSSIPARSDVKSELETVTEAIWQCSFIDEPLAKAMIDLLTLIAKKKVEA